MLNNFTDPDPMLDLAQINFTALPPAQRLLLAQALLDSVMFDASGPRLGGDGLQSELSPSQRDELRSRADDIRNGHISCEPWETVYTRLQSRF